jgi:hypothetical protein
MDLGWSVRVVSYSLSGDILKYWLMIYAGIQGQEASFPPNVFCSLLRCDVCLAESLILTVVAHLDA